MRKKTKKNIFILLLLLLPFSSCSRPDYILSPNEFEELLFQLHLYEGVLQADPYGNSHLAREKTHRAILKKQGVTQAELDSTVAYYTRHPKEFHHIYLTVNERMEKMKTAVENRKYHPIDSDKIDVKKLWRKPHKYVINTDTNHQQIAFEIKRTEFLPTDCYQLSFRQRLMCGDSVVKKDSLTVFAVLYVNYLNGKRDSVFTPIVADSVFRKYTLTLQPKDTLKIASISGKLLGTSIDSLTIDAYIDSIALQRIFKPNRQSQFEEMVSKMDTTNVKISEK